MFQGGILVLALGRPEACLRKAPGLLNSVAVALPRLAYLVSYSSPLPRCLVGSVYSEVLAVGVSWPGVVLDVLLSTLSCL